MASLDGTDSSEGNTQKESSAWCGSARRTRRAEELSDDGLNHYLKRIDPEVAASFTGAQREALKTLLVGRGVARHLVEMRRSIPVGNKRYYLVFLLGPERRDLRRLYSQGMATMGFNLLGYLMTALGCILPLALVIALLT